MKAPFETTRFEEAVRWWRTHLPNLRDADFEAMLGVTGARARRWTTKAQLDLVTQVWTGIDSAVAEGTTLDDFKKRMTEAVKRAWGGSAEATEHRLETIFRDNVQQAYGAGRIAEMTQPEVLESHPVWRFSNIRDMRTSEICTECGGTILPADHPWWRTHQPPLHHRCRSTIIAMRQKEAERRGFTKRPSKTEVPEGFGSFEDEKEWTPKRKDGYPKALIDKWSQKHGPAPG